MTKTNSSRLAKNSLYMYVRMILSMIIALYSSRMLLKTIGVEGYGIYSVVGSVISVVSLLQFFFSFTTQRFLNYEMGKSNSNKLQLIFNMSIIVNLVISILFIIIVEIVGYYFFEYKINVPLERYDAAIWVFHISVISAVVMIMASPYDALILANEKFNFYAFTSILKNLLNLIIIFFIPLSECDSLIFYAILLLLVQAIIMMISFIYCNSKFQESKFKLMWNKMVFKQLLSFAGWQLLGTSASSLTQGGLNLLFNVFGGPIVNAARGISYQLNGLIHQFINNANSAITPYCIKASAQGDNYNLFRMFFFSSKAYLAISFSISVPIIYMSEYLLKIWLGTFPEYTIGFVSIVLLCSIIKSLHIPIDLLFKSVGVIKQYQIADGIILSLPLLASYFLLKNGFSVYVALFSTVVFEFIDLIAILYIAKNICKLDIKKYFRQVLSYLFISLFIGTLGYFLNISYGHDWYISLFLSISVLFFVLPLIYKFSFENSERDIVMMLFKKVFIKRY